MSTNNEASEYAQEKGFNASLNNVFEKAVQARPEDQLKLALAEIENHKAAAISMARALRDIYNDIGYMEEVEERYGTVHLVVSEYDA